LGAVSFAIESARPSMTTVRRFEPPDFSTAFGIEGFKEHGNER